MAPMSFQTSIPHITGQVRYTLQWSLSGNQNICISNPQWVIKEQLKKTSNERCFQVNQHFPTNPIQVLNLHRFLKVFLCTSNDIFDINKKKIDVGWREDRKYSSDKANIGNPKVNSGCFPLTVNRT